MRSLVFKGKYKDSPWSDLIKGRDENKILKSIQ